MDPDLALVIGIVFGVFAVPSIMSAFSDRRAPRASMLLLLIAGGLILFALQTRPGGYDWPEIPDAFMRVVARLFG